MSRIRPTSRGSICTIPVGMLPTSTNATTMTSTSTTTIKATTTPLPHRCLALSLLGLLAACGGQPAHTANGQPGADGGLPSPQQDGGAVTGMPETPGPGAVAISGTPPPQDVQVDVPEIELPNPEAGLLPGAQAAASDSAPPNAAEPTAQDAQAVLHDYYAAIDGRSYARAYALWSDNGGASGQSPQQFVDGFAGIRRISAELGVPGEVDAGAGQRRITVPVTVTTIPADGNARRQAGSYTLRRSVVEGASAEQRAWRIASVDLRDAPP